MKHSTAGFSIIELVLVLALVGVVALFSMNLGIDSISRSAVVSERDLFVSLLLRGARAASLANLNEVSHGIKIDNSAHEYILFNGNTFDPLSTTNRRIPYTQNNIVVTNTGGDTIVFEQLSGKVTAGSGTITIDNGDKNQTVLIGATGQIDW
jgi:prepilin-type N-terminal cleavage/methylation domain-containing protein